MLRVTLLQMLLGGSVGTKKLRAQQTLVRCYRHGYVFAGFAGHWGAHALKVTALRQFAQPENKRVV